jgi:CheY-like chemotaxis protein
VTAPLFIHLTHEVVSQVLSRSSLLQVERVSWERTVLAAAVLAALGLVGVVVRRRERGLGLCRQPRFEAEAAENGTGSEPKTQHLCGQAHPGHLAGATRSPVERVPDSPARVETPTREDPAALRVLLVEDDEDVRFVLRRLLEHWGCRVVAEAASGDAGVEHARATPDVDAVLSDLHMSGLHGVRFVEELHEVRPGLPVVFLTGYAEGAEAAALAQRGIEVGTKPPERQRLVAALQRAAAPPVAA